LIGKKILRQFRKRTVFACIAAIVAAQIGRASAEDKLFAEAVMFTGTLTYLSTKVPGFMLVAVRKW
jgi:serine-type D-Ala-D-Ala carboxypeptidase/endopeptidase